MKSLIFAGAVTALPFAVGAQTTGFTVRAGYSFSGSFRNPIGNSGNLEGFEIGADVPLGLPSLLGSLPIQISFSPSILFGSTGSSAGFDGDIYRLMLVGQYQVPSGPYLRFGAGYSYSAADNHDFSSLGVYELQYGVGIPIFSLPPAGKVSLEVTYHQSSSAQVSGWTIGLSAKI